MAEGVILKSKFSELIPKLVMLSTGHNSIKSIYTYFFVNASSNIKTIWLFRLIMFSCVTGTKDNFTFTDVGVGRMENRQFDIVVISTTGTNDLCLFYINSTAMVMNNQLTMTTCQFGNNYSKGWFIFLNKYSSHSKVEFYFISSFLVFRIILHIYTTHLVA